jgi:hypothetical protein
VSVFWFSANDSFWWVRLPCLHCKWKKSLFINGENQACRYSYYISGSSLAYMQQLVATRGLI